jgi:hypothetical protein
MATEWLAEFFDYSGAARLDARAGGRARDFAGINLQSEIRWSRRQRASTTLETILKHREITGAGCRLIDLVRLGFAPWPFKMGS